jgi:SAUR family protein
MKQSNKGHVPVLVGKGEDMERIWVSIKVIHHPKIVEFLEQSAKEYGYQQGVLRIICDVDDFKDILADIS